ncbi:hypothetical protein ABF86_04910 [Nitrosomonas sp. GH22]|nr:hypothetical protein [Nitrosomonas sp. GH22]
MLQTDSLLIFLLKIACQSGLALRFDGSKSCILLDCFNLLGFAKTAKEGVAGLLLLPRYSRS